MSNTPAYYLNSAGVQLSTGGAMVWSNTPITPGTTGTIYDYIDWSQNTILDASLTNVTLNNGNQNVTGNASSNVIIAGTGAERIGGGGGNDVFVASSDQASPDTFVINQKDSGSNTIYGFKTAIDSVALTNFTNFKSFADVQHNLKQVGANTVLSLGNGSTLTFAGTTASSLTATDFALPENLSGLKLTFDDEFNSFSGSATGVGTTWKETYAWGNRTLSGNNEAEYYSDSSVGANPFSLQNGVLDITAQKGSNGLNLPWNSGEINTQASFAQEYGVFEMRAELPAGQGMWPAFWLLPTNGSSPQEIDVMEMIGSDPSTTYSAVHATGAVTGTGSIGGANSSTGFHTYAVDWEPNTITFYVDGNAVGVEKTPTDMNTPMYMIANLAVGGAGSWPGATDSTTPATDTMQIDYIRAYATNNTINVSGTAALASAMAGPAVAITAQTLANDTGASTSDNITSDGRVSLSGTVSSPIGTSVQILDGTTVLGSATLNGNGGWTFSATLATGTHTLHAVATDLNGNVTVTAADPIIVVATAPLVAITSQALAGNGTVTLAGTIADASTTTVEIMDGTTALGAALLNSSGGWTYTGVLATGSHTLHAVATDLAGNTTITAAQPILTVAPSDTLVLNLSEDAYLGDAKFTVTVDGKAVGGTQAVTALHNQGQSEAFTLAGNFGSGPHVIGVYFTNDQYGGSATMDRNLYVDSIVFDGQTTTENSKIAGSFTANYSIAAVIANTAPVANTLALANVASIPATTAPDTLVLSLSEDAYLGDAQFTVMVDGKAIGGTQAVTALHNQGQAQNFTLTGNFGSGPHLVSIYFANDMYGGSATMDRNLYVNSITLNGQTTTENSEIAGSYTANYLVGTANETISNNANDTLTGTGATNLLFGNGSNANYVVRSADQNDTIINATGGSGTLSEDVASSKLWFAQSGNDLVIDALGTTQQTVIKNWYAGEQINQITSSDHMTLDSAVQNLVQAMANFTAANPAFNPQSSGAIMPADSTLQTTLAAAWH